MNSQTLQDAAGELSDLFVALHNVRFWHKADITIRSTNVCFWG